MSNFGRRIALVSLAVVALAARHVATATAVAPLEIPFELSGNHVVLPVTAQGHTYHFVLDTGAGGSLIDMKRAEELGVPLGQPFAARGGGPGTTRGAALTAPLTVAVGAGAITAPASISAALDFSDLSTHAGRDLDGIIGGSFIRNYVVEIDYEHLKLRLHEPASFTYAGKGTTLPLTFKTGFPHTTGTLKVSDQESFDVDCVLDVGASLQVIVTTAVVESHDLATKLSASKPMPVGRGAGGTSNGRMARLPGFQLGDILVKRPVAVLVGQNAGILSDSSAFEVNVGTGLMRHFTVFFDYGRANVTFEPNGLFTEPFEHDMVGMALTTEGRPYAKRIVESVVPEFPADRAGLNADDRLRSIDDVAADALSIDQLRKLFTQDGRTYRVVVERDGKDVTLSLTPKRIV